MPDADFFGRLGVYAKKKFFDADLCQRIRMEMNAAESQKALTVRYDSGDEVLDEKFRNCLQAAITKETRSLVDKRILALRPELEKHFNVTLSRYEKPSFLLYREGDFFAPHIDVRKSPGSSSSDNAMTRDTADRKISIVLFLNRQAEDAGPDLFSGGPLVLFGLLNNPDLKHVGFPLIAEEGLVVAFSSDVMHEVKPVTKGERYTVVSWFS